MLFAAFESEGIAFDKLYAPHLKVDFSDFAEHAKYDVIIDRSVSQTRGLAISRMFDAFGVTMINRPEVIELCGDKLATNAAMAKAGVPTPRTAVAFTYDALHDLCEYFGFPVGP